MLRPVIASLVRRKGLLLLLPIGRVHFNRCETGKMLNVQINVPSLPTLLFLLGWLPDSDWSRFSWQGESEDLEALQERSQRHANDDGVNAFAVSYRLSFWQRRTLFADGMVLFNASGLHKCGPPEEWQKLACGYIVLADDEHEYNRLKAKVLL